MSEFEGGFREKEEETKREFSSSEKAVLDSLTEGDISRIREWKKESLTRERSAIVGVRSEDLVYFLECIHRGYIPVGGEGFRMKGDSKKYFFINTNPESSFLREKEPSLIEPEMKQASFKKIALGNVSLYSRVAIIQTIRREVMPFLDEAQLLKQEAKRLGDEPGALHPEVLEEFYDDLVDEIQKERSSMAYRDFQKALRNNKKAFEIYKELVPTFDERGGIILAFSEELCKKYKGTNKAPITHTNGEIAFSVPDGKLSLDVLYGFEALGAYEDKMLEALNV